MQELCDEVPNTTEESESGKMTEIEKLRADLQTLCAAAIVPGMRPKTYDQIRNEIVFNQQRIAALEAEQAPPDPWAEAKKVVSWYEMTSPGWNDNSVAKYVRHLEAIIERDALAYGKLATLSATLLKERNEARAELAKRPVLEAADSLLQEMERHKAATADYLREKLAELTTIYNAIPPACPEAQALVKVRIDSVKKEMQGNA